MEIYPNLHLLAGPESNAYLYTDDDSVVLVDGGMPGRIKILDYLDRINRKLTHIFVTHADIDHVGDLARIQRETGARVLAGSATAALLRAGKMPSHGWNWFDWAMHRLYSYPPVKAEAVAAETVVPVLGGLQAIATPGHTLDHTAFFSRATGILFSGDALHTRQGSLSESGRFISADYAQSRRSALKLIGLAPAIFACGHGKPLQEHTADDLMMLVQRLRP